MKNNKIYILVLMPLFVIFACGQTNSERESVTVESSNIDSNITSNTQTVPFTVNSDGSKTFVSSVTLCAKDVPKEANTQACGWSGSAMSFYAVGQNYVAMDEKSLKLNVLEVNGKDFLMNRKQEANYELGSFPKASDDGKYVKWSVDIKDGFHDTKDKLKISGSLDVYTSDKMLEKTTETFNLTDFSSFSIGPVNVKGTRASEENVRDFFANDNDLEAEDMDILEKLSNLEGELGKDATKEDAMKALSEMGLSEDKIENLMGKLISYMFQEAFSGLGMGGDNGVGLEIIGDTSTVERVELHSGGQKVKSNGWSGWNDSKTYNFTKPSTEQVQVKIFYWNKPEKVKLKFNF